MNEEALRARFDVIAIDGEGILLDREGGSVYRLNPTAYEIWAEIIAGQSTEAMANRLARRFRIDQSRAARDTREVLQQIPNPALKPVVDPWRWGITERGYGSFDGERLICEVDRKGLSLRLAEGLEPSEAHLRGHLKPVAPKVLALHEIFVLHASAVEIEGSLLVISGRSGAGKTTTARAFERAGERIVSEDQLVIVPSPAGQAAVTSGETAIRAWIVEQAARLARSPNETVSCETLLQCVDGPFSPIGQILLIDANRRKGTGIQLERLTKPDALVALLESAYIASLDAEHWRTRLERLRDLAGGINTSVATMPDGLEALDEAVSAFLQRAPSSATK